MPTISRFYGISIILNYRNEHPPAHFHAVYGELRASVQISPLSLLDGNLPPRVLGLVFEWAVLHQAELIRAWDDAINQRPVNPIDPLV